MCSTGMLYYKVLGSPAQSIQTRVLSGWRLKELPGTNGSVSGVEKTRQQEHRAKVWATQSPIEATQAGS